MNGTNTQAFPGESGGDLATGTPTRSPAASGSNSGKNWTRFLAVVDDERVEQADGVARARCSAAARLDGIRFLDIGSGSGLFSLAARRLGADVLSFDYDPYSVACTREMKARYRPEDPGWRIERGSVLDPAFMAQLGRFDVVYSWGVLHHTGAMWEALDQAQRAVRDRGSSLHCHLQRHRQSERALEADQAHLYAIAPVTEGAVCLGGQRSGGGQESPAVARSRPSGRLRADVDELRPQTGDEPLARHHRLGWRVPVRVREAGCHFFVLSRPWLCARHAEDGRRIGVQ